MQQTTRKLVISDEKKELSENKTSSEIKNILFIYCSLHGFEEKNQPDKAIASNVWNFLIIISCPILVKF